MMSIIGGSHLVLVFTVLVLCGLSVQLVQCQEPVSATTPASTPDPVNDVPPFLLLGVGVRLYSLPYTWPNPPQATDDKILLYEGSSFIHYISGITYHYRRRLVFWATTDGTITTASFQNRTRLTNISRETVINRPSFYKHIGDLSVDWINDKLYWADRDGGKIEEWDLETNQRRTIVESSEAAAFNGLTVYPYLDYGWIYWTDNEAGKIERVAITGESRTLIRSGQPYCVWPLAIDYSEQKVYWTDTCEHVLRSVDIGEPDKSATRIEIDTVFSGTSSITLFEDVLYWNEEGTVKATNKSIDNGDVITIFQGSSTSVPLVTVPVEVVHPKKQPNVEEFLDIIHENIDMELLNETCPPCVHGVCVPPRMCRCFGGWTGDNCTVDVNECDLGTSGCDIECNNTMGGFYCSCNSTTYLDSDGKTCIPIDPTTSVIELTVSSSGIGPEETSTDFVAALTSSLAATVTSEIDDKNTQVLVSSDTVLPTAASASNFVVALTEFNSATKELSLSLEPSSSVLLDTTQMLYTSSTTSEAYTMLPKSESRLETTAASATSTELPELQKSSSVHLGYMVSEQVAISTPPLPPLPTTSSTLLSKFLSTSSGLTSSLQVSPSLSPVTSYKISLTPSPTSYGLSSSSPAPLSSPVPSSSSVTISSSHVTRSSLSPSQMTTKPQETSIPTVSEVDSSTESGTEATASNQMTLIIIVASAGGACAILVIVVVIMIIAVVHYFTKRCGSYTVNPDPSKESGTPSWIVVHSGSPANHSNGITRQTKSVFRAHSPTCSSNSFKQ